MAAPQLIIFDCDGVLVDSEPIANRILAKALTAAGYPCGVEQSVARFVGRSLASIVDEVEAALGHKLPSHFTARLQAETYAAFRRDLEPVPGVAAALDQIQSRKCVASSGAVEKMELTLGLTGLRHHFGDHLFSAAMVPRGKPFPDLFLHAAEAMNAQPNACIVVEDSLPGVEAARAAGMRVLGYAGGSHTLPGHADNLAGAGAETFSAMSELPELIAAPSG